MPFCVSAVTFTSPELSLAVIGDHVTTLLLSVTYICKTPLGQESKAGFVLSEKRKLFPLMDKSLQEYHLKHLQAAKKYIFMKIELCFH